MNTMVRVAGGWLLWGVMASAQAATPLPTGQATPEGAATEFTVSFIERDAKRFRASVLPAYGGDQTRTDYTAFLDQMAANLAQEAAQPSSPPPGPKEVLTVFQARPLSQAGPASYGYAAFGFTDVVFVDVTVALHAGPEVTNRTLVVQKSDKMWYVHALPPLSPLLSAGLEDESASTQVAWTKAP